MGLGGGSTVLVTMEVLTPYGGTLALHGRKKEREAK